MATSKGLLGDTYTVADKAVAVSIERYNELIKKETFYDELTKQCDPHVVLQAKLQFEEDK